jgi:Na+/alanine symporter
MASPRTDLLFLNSMDENMNAGSAVLSVQKPNALLAIFVGGMLAGSLDLGSAFITYGASVPRAIAAGLLGREALRGGLGTYGLGIVLQFFIATSAAAVYYMASRKLAFLKEHALICGLFFGIAVFLVMNLIVVPLSALHGRGPFQLAGLIQGLLVHMFLIGLPISFSVRQFAK